MRFPTFDKALKSSEECVKYVVDREVLCDRVGSKSDVASWKVKEVGVGNINYIFVVEGPKGAVCLK